MNKCFKIAALVIATYASTDATASNQFTAEQIEKARSLGQCYNIAFVGPVVTQRMSLMVLNDNSISSTDKPARVQQLHTIGREIHEMLYSFNDAGNYLSSRGYTELYQAYKDATTNYKVDAQTVDLKDYFKAADACKLIISQQ